MEQGDKPLILTQNYLPFLFNQHVEADNEMKGMNFPVQLERTNTKTNKCDFNTSTVGFLEISEMSCTLLLLLRQ